MAQVTRFVRELNGEFGEYWKNEALKQIADIEKKYENGGTSYSSRLQDGKKIRRER